MRSVRCSLVFRKGTIFGRKGLLNALNFLASGKARGPHHGYGGKPLSIRAAVSREVRPILLLRILPAEIHGAVGSR